MTIKSAPAQQPSSVFFKAKKHIYLSLQPRQGALELCEAVEPILLALAVLCDDIGGGVLDEGFAGEFAGDLSDLGLDFGDFSVEAFLLRGGINDTREREVNRSDMRGAGRMALRRGLAEGEGFRMQEDGADWGFFGL